MSPATSPRGLHTLCLSPLLLVALLLARCPAHAADPPAGRPVTLDEALALALERNPGIEAASAGVRASEGDAQQARALPNPELDLEVEGFGLDLAGEDSAEATLSLSQEFLLGGKRKARTASARWGIESARAASEMAVRDLRAEVGRRFATLLGAQGGVRILEEGVRAAREILTTVGALVEAGEVSRIEESRARADAAVAETDLDAGRTGLAVARRALASLWGETEPAFTEARGDLEAPLDAGDGIPPVPAVEGLPDIRRNRSEASRLEAEWELERALAVPDLRAFGGYREYGETDQSALVAGIGIALPVFDRNRGAILAARARLEEARALERAEALRLATEAAIAWERYGAALRAARTLRSTVLPSAREVLAGVTEGYRRGKFRLLDLLDARRTLAEAELRWNDALVELNLARADLERLAPAVGGASR